MNYKTIILAPAIAFLIFGCQPSNEKKQAKDESKPAEVIIFEADSFPKEMVGTWENEEHGWIFQFEENGRLAKIRHTFARADLTAGKTATYPLREGGKGVIVPGPWQVRYDGKAKELIVEILIDSFDYETAGNAIRGASRDIFIGKLSDKPGVWNPQWISMPKYIVTTADTLYKEHELPIDEGVVENGEIPFQKVDPGTIE